jgi:hypothetical protein
MKYRKKRIDEFQIGEQIIWLHDRLATEGVVISISPPRVQISVKDDEDDGIVLRWVMPESLRVKE